MDIINELNNFPPEPTSFIGREHEIAEIVALLGQPACRLLTLVGPGGVGKTRLAIKVASAQNLPAFGHGIYFVALDIVGADLLVSTLVNTLRFPLSGSDSDETQLCNYLQDKEMLLLLDNFEQLMTPASINFLLTLLHTCPAVKLLVTSREVMNLQEEWLYHVRGLPAPGDTLPGAASTGSNEDDFETYSAIKLLVERIRRVRPKFSAVDERPHLIRICQLVDGLPLAIELAAAWAKTLACPEIAAEIQRNVDFLTTTLRDVPEHHRSMRAVFDQTWRLALPKEQDVFRRLSVFRGGFTYDAARQVADASLLTLSALVDKSLLWAEAEGRYQIHEMLRQYGAEKLAQAPDDLVRVYEWHSNYYADFLQQREQAIFSPKQQQVLQEIAAEWENIRAAWRWAVNQKNVGNIRRACQTYYNFCDFQGRFKEATDAFAEAIVGFDQPDANRETRLTLALLQVLQGWNYIRLGHFDTAQAAFEYGQSIYRQLDTEPPPGFGTDPLLGLALLAQIVGNYDQALQLGAEARRKHEIRDDKLNLQIVFYVLGNAALAQGDYEAAEANLQQAYTLTQQTSHSWMMAYVLRELGNVARGLGRFEQARQHYQASFQLKELLNDPEGQGSALNHLAQVAAIEENHEEAKRLYAQSLSIYQDINDRGGLATTMKGLGMAECALGNFQAARPYFQQALHLSTSMQFTPLTLAILTGIGHLLLQTGRPAFGLELLTLAWHHPAGDRETKDRAKQALDYFQIQVAADIFETAVRRGQTTALETILPAVHAELSASLPASEGQRPADETPPVQPAPDQSALIEPLTPRELEVLQLVAQGLTNQQIAEELVISIGTAKWYTGQIYGKLGVNNRTQAVARARELEVL